MAALRGAKTGDPTRLNVSSELGQEATYRIMKDYYGWLSVIDPLPETIEIITRGNTDIIYWEMPLFTHKCLVF